MTSKMTAMTPAKLGIRMRFWGRDLHGSVRLLAIVAYDTNWHGTSMVAYITKWYGTSTGS